jgi:hypothetical protein
MSWRNGRTTARPGALVDQRRRSALAGGVEVLGFATSTSQLELAGFGVLAGRVLMLHRPAPPAFARQLAHGTGIRRPAVERAPTSPISRMQAGFAVRSRRRGSSARLMSSRCVRTAAEQLVGRGDGHSLCLARRSCWQGIGSSDDLAVERGFDNRSAC